MYTVWLLSQGNSVLHLLEGPSSSVLRILNNLASHRHFYGSTPVQSGTIIYNIEDRPRRVFPEWFSGAIPEKKAASEDIKEDNCTIVAFDLASKLLKIGDILQSEHQEELDFSR